MRTSGIDTDFDKQLHPPISDEKAKVLHRVETANTKEEYQEAMHSRHKYLEKYPMDWDVLASGDLLSRIGEWLDEDKPSAVN